MEYLLGPDGDLRSLPVIEHREDVASTRDYPIGLQHTLAGRAYRDILGRSRGRWRLDWRYLGNADRDLVYALASGHLGSPLRLVDPSQPNQQIPQLASGGSETRDVALDFKATFGDLAFIDTDTPSEVLTTGATRWVRVDTSAGDLVPGEIGAGHRISVRQGVPIRFSLFWRQVSGTASASLGVDHWNAQGTKTLVTPAAVSVPSSWAEVSMTWTPVAGATQAQLAVRIASGQSASTIEVTGLMATTDGTTVWRPGGGSALVVIEAVTEDRQSLNETDMTLRVREV